MKTCLLLLPIVLLTACTTVSVGPSTGSSIRGIHIASISVTPDSDLKPDSLVEYQDHTVQDSLTAAIHQRLVDTGKLDANGGALTIKVTDMRLRSTALAVMVGVMAGSDHLNAKVQVLSKGVVVKTFTAAASRTSGAMAAPGARGRIAGMCEELANSIVSQL